MVMIAPIPDVASSLSSSFNHQSKMNLGQDSHAFQPSSASDKQTFESMMQSHDVDNVAKLMPASKTQAPSMIEKLAATQNAQMNDTFRSSREMMKAAPNMSMAELTAYGNEAAMNMAITTTQFNLASSVGKSAGKGVETLMRNQ